MVGSEKGLMENLYNPTGAGLPCSLLKKNLGLIPSEKGGCVNGRQKDKSERKREGGKREREGKT